MPVEVRVRGAIAQGNLRKLPARLGSGMEVSAVYGRRARGRQVVR